MTVRFIIKPNTFTAIVKELGKICITANGGYVSNLPKKLEVMIFEYMPILGNHLEDNEIEIFEADF